MQILLQITYVANSGFMAKPPCYFASLHLSFAILQNYWVLATNSRHKFLVACKCLPISRNYFYQAVVQYQLKKLHYQQFVKIYKLPYCTPLLFAMMQNNNVRLQNSFVILQNHSYCTTNNFAKISLYYKTLIYIELHCHSPPSSNFEH